ncbi:hypothetical protein BV22DRAFT_1013033 [Leucogyrophana mollusca]|uniref:Uncharacterized protein n=1 Tax=Leucogyrophana mollusca TaxID=85980 RepID=A0ACB8BH92_9AGAM|nr:hypothetical protein BV22DRAFT_1013033 [Leucogyrophana mollusca]
MVATGEKRKKPPTFQHLPINRAKKLKQTWVEAKKIKSQWRAQKKREGLPIRKHVTPSGEAEVSGAQDASLERNVSPAHSNHKPEKQERKQNSAPPKSSRRQRSSEREPSSSGDVSLRKLSRQAYSRNSLHTQKSNPLHRRRESGGTHGGSSHHDQGGKAVAAVSRDRGRGKGQPDMKLRMTAMLEKIKRDFT